MDVDTSSLRVPWVVFLSGDTPGTDYVPTASEGLPPGLAKHVVSVFRQFHKQYPPKLVWLFWSPGGSGDWWVLTRVTDDPKREVGRRTLEYIATILSAEDFAKLRCNPARVMQSPLWEQIRDSADQGSTAAVSLPIAQFGPALVDGAPHQAPFGRDDNGHEQRVKHFDNDSMGKLLAFVAQDHDHERPPQSFATWWPSQGAPPDFFHFLLREFIPFLTPGDVRETAHALFTTLHQVLSATTLESTAAQTAQFVLRDADKCRHELDQLCRAFNDGDHLRATSARDEAGRHADSVRKNLPPLINQLARQSEARQSEARQSEARQSDALPDLLADLSGVVDRYDLLADKDLPAVNLTRARPSSSRLLEPDPAAAPPAKPRREKLRHHAPPPWPALLRKLRDGLKPRGERKPRKTQAPEEMMGGEARYLQKPEKVAASGRQALGWRKLAAIFAITLVLGAAAMSFLLKGRGKPPKPGASPPPTQPLKTTRPGQGPSSPVQAQPTPSATDDGTEDLDALRSNLTAKAPEIPTMAYEKAREKTERKGRRLRENEIEGAVDNVLETLVLELSEGRVGWQDVKEHDVVQPVVIERARIAANNGAKVGWENYKIRLAAERAAEAKRQRRLAEAEAKRRRLAAAAQTISRSKGRGTKGGGSKGKGTKGAGTKGAGAKGAGAKGAGIKLPGHLR